jgi:ATP-dependent Lon protease
MRVLDFIPGTPFLTARTLEIPEPIGSSPEIEARLLNLRRLSIDASRLLPQVPQELIVALESADPAGALADLAAMFMDIKPKEKQEILEAIDPVARLLSERIEVLRLSNEIGLQTKATFDERQARQSFASRWRRSSGSSGRAMARPRRSRRARR